MLKNELKLAPKFSLRENAWLTQFLRGQLRPLFVYLRSFQATVGLGGIRTWIVRREGKHADHWTTIADQCLIVLLSAFFKHLPR